MNKHTKLFVGFLAVLLLLLIVGTISFSFDISQDTNQQDSTAESGLHVDGYEIFQDENALYGVKDSAGNTLIDAQWQKLQFISADYLAAYQEQTAENVFGILDLSGNVVAPFVYCDITVLFSDYYLLEFSDTAQYALYNASFQPLTSVVWDGCEWDDSTVTLTQGQDTFVYCLDETGMLGLSEMDLSRTGENASFTVRADEANASLLSADAWIYVTDQVQKTLEILLTSDIDSVLQVTDEAHESVVRSVLTQEDFNVLRIDRTVSLSTQDDSDTDLTLIWEVEANVRIADEGQKRQTITILMRQNENEIWVVTDLQLE